MIYELNGKLMTTVYTQADIILNNILLAMQEETFSQTKAAKIVGGEKKLLTLVEKGLITVVQPKKNVQNGKWYYNAAQVLMHCKPRKKSIKKSNQKY